MSWYFKYLDCWRASLKFELAAHEMFHTFADQDVRYQIPELDRQQQVNHLEPVDNCTYVYLFLLSHDVVVHLFGHCFCIQSRKQKAQFGFETFKQPRVNVVGVKVCQWDGGIPATFLSEGIREASKSKFTRAVIWVSSTCQMTSNRTDIDDVKTMRNAVFNLFLLQE